MFRNKLSIVSLMLTLSLISPAVIAHFGDHNVGNDMMFHHYNFSDSHYFVLALVLVFALFLINKVKR